MQWIIKPRDTFPGTEFAMKANLAVREAKWLEEWYADNIYQQIRASRIGKKNMCFTMALVCQWSNSLGLCGQ